MTLPQAQAAHGAANVVRYELPFDECDRAVCEGEREGYISMIVDKRSHKFVGATIVNGVL